MNCRHVDNNIVFLTINADVAININEEEPAGEGL